VLPGEFRSPPQSAGALIPMAWVNTEPGGSIVVKVPLSSRKPWVVPLTSVYRPTIWLRA